MVTWFVNEGPLFDLCESCNSSSQQASYELSEDNQTLTIKSAWQSGQYECLAQNRGGTLIGTLKLSVDDPSRALTLGLSIGISMALIVAVITVIILLWKVRVYNCKIKALSKAEIDMFVVGNPDAINPNLRVDEQSDLLPYNREYEFDRNKLRLGKQLGSGAFGRVVKAEASDIVPWEPLTTVAVKMVKQHADIAYIRALMSEIKIMIHLGKHLHIVNLLGACTNELNRRELLVIIEYCRFGNLQKYLQLHRNVFISQIHPETAEIDFSIGTDVIAAHGDNLPMAREIDEMSAAYANRNTSLTSTTTGGTENGNLGRRLPSSANGSGQVPSVRYVADPSRANLERLSHGRRARQASFQSDYIDGQDQIILTDMTALTEENEEDTLLTSATADVDIRACSTSPRAQRSVSIASSRGGPGWRSNMRGDYDEQTIRPISTKDLICWAYQVARGMDYIASKKIMHGDLACRNILLASDNVVKICDFGLAKDIYKTDNYQKKTDGPLPIKWMALESIRDRVFSTQSDVWSFGIVLWEMFTLGRQVSSPLMKTQSIAFMQPYPGVPHNELYERLRAGYRMEKPDFCPRPVYATMSACWDEQVDARPSFGLLTELLGKLASFWTDGECTAWPCITGQQ